MKERMENSVEKKLYSAVKSIRVAGYFCKRVAEETLFSVDSYFKSFHFEANNV
jgi:hypothetical protein